MDRNEAPDFSDMEEVNQNDYRTVFDSAPNKDKEPFDLFRFEFFFFFNFFWGEGSINSDNRGKIYSALKVLKELRFQDQGTNSKKGD